MRHGESTLVWNQRTLAVKAHFIANKVQSSGELQFTTGSCVQRAIKDAQDRTSEHSLSSIIP